MKILIIISQYLPAQTPNSQRWQSIIEGMQEKGLEVAVLTTKRRGYKSGSTLGNVTIYRAGYNTLKDWAYDFFRIKNRRNDAGNTFKKSHWISLCTEKIVDLFWRKQYWPDGSKLFVKPGIRCGSQLLRKQQFTHVISVGLPYSCHLIARKLKEMHPDLFWLMDIQDPFCYSTEFWVNNAKNFKEKNIEEERLAFEKADAISLTNQTALDRYSALFDHFTHKCQIIPPLLDPPQHLSIVPLNPKDRSYHILYAGSFYENVRTPMSFLKLIEHINREDPSFINQLHFHFVGQIDRFTASWFEKYAHLNSLFTFHGFKAKNETFDLMYSADFLLNFGNSTDYHLPSKVVDYLYLNKSLINIIQREDDSSKSFFGSRLDLINLELHDLAEDCRRLKSFIFQNRTPASLNIEGTKDFTKHQITEDYLALLNRPTS